MCDCNQETNAKMQAEKAYYAQGQTPSTNLGYATDSPKQVPARERLMNRLNRSYADNDNLHRAIKILEAHPEFEDFIWLFQSGLV